MITILGYIGLAIATIAFILIIIGCLTKKNIFPIIAVVLGLAYIILIFVLAWTTV